MIALAVAIPAVMGICLLLYIRLRMAIYSQPASAVIVALSIMQIGMAPATSWFPALLLIVVVCLTAIALPQFAQHQNVRSVIALGGTLALVQVISPLASLTAATLIPILVRKSPASGTLANRTALLVLLLFIPASSAAILFYAARLSHTAVFTWLSIPYEVRFPRLWNGFPTHEMLAALWLPVIGWPIWMSAALVRTRSAALLAAVAVATVVMSGVAVLCDGQPLAMVVPALAALSVFALCEWQVFETREILAVATMAASAGLAWRGVGWAV